MKFFHNLRCKIARKRFERALDSVSNAEFERLCAMQKFFHENVFAPGDRLILTFDNTFGVRVEGSENRSQHFNNLDKDFDL